MLDYEKGYKRQPETKTDAKSILGFAMQTDRKIKSNKPNIVVKNYKRKICLPIDIAVLTNNQSKTVIK